MYVISGGGVNLDGDAAGGASGALVVTVFVGEATTLPGMAGKTPTRGLPRGVPRGT